MLPRFALFSAFALISITAIFFTVRIYRHNDVPQTSWLPEINRSPSRVAPNQSDWLSTHELKYPFKYGCRQVVVQADSKLSRASLTKIDHPLFDTFEVVESKEQANHSAPQCSGKPLLLDVPAFPKDPVDASHIFFGAQTTIGRLDDSIPQLTRWLANTGAKLYVVVIESEGVAADPNYMSDLQSQMRSLGVDATLVPALPDDSFPQRYFSLVNIMYQNRQPKTQWVSLIDDDTFFPSMPGLLSMLAEHDPKEEHYIGALSEDWWAVSRYGLMGFGGAGLFFSLPLAEVMDTHTKDCKHRLSSSAGDITVMDCVYRHTSTKLTHIPELHQVDAHGDLTGFYESGRLYLSLHHWKNGGVKGEGYMMDKMHLISDVCGDCFLQRWQFGEDMMLTNGFSITSYPKGHLKEVDMDKMEATWDDEQNVRHSLDPSRPRLAKEEEKFSYDFLDSVSSDGWVRQLYLHTGTGEDMDTVLELAWKDNDTG